jgi:DNA mismatch endonuclease, patch repair protein
MKIPRAPRPSSAAISAAMRGNRSTGTRPEWIVRSLLFRLGYRYKLHMSELPGKPDVCFPARRKAIFVHGCLWHQHASKHCPLSARPRSNLTYWSAKLDRNRERDIQNKKALSRLGWHVLTIWECDTRHPISLKARVRRFLGSTRVSEIN